jgi:hypothetical protein
MANYDKLKESNDISRVITDDDDARKFLDSIRIREWLEQDDQKEFLKDEGNIENKITYLANNILEAEKQNVKAFPQNTLDSKKHRSSLYKTDAKRKRLREQIIKECMENKVIDDERVRLGMGGMLPKNSDLKNDKKLFFIIGSPASGKSSIANKFADAYGAFMLDSDLIKRKIPEFSIPLYGASLVHKESNIILHKIFNTHLSLGTNIVYQLVGAEYDEFQYDEEKQDFVNKGFHELVKSIEKEYGYQIFIVLPELDREIATRRALRRFVETKRYVPLTKILDRYSNNAIRTFYKMHCFEPNYGYIVVDTNVPFNQSYKKVYCNKVAEEVFNAI